MGAQLGDEIVYAEAGDFVFKPRGQWHSFWNASDEPARILEIIAPAGFEDYFREMAVTPFDELPALAAKYDLEIDFDSIPGLVEQHNLVMPEIPA
jgi:hypothetical protein